MEVLLRDEDCEGLLGTLQAVAEGTAVDIAIEDNRLVVKPVQHQYRLRDLLKRIDRRNGHAEVSTGPAVGKEAW